MEPKEPLSFSRLGPMDPKQVRYELAEEMTEPVPLTDGPTGQSRQGQQRRSGKRRGRE